MKKIEAAAILKLVDRFTSPAKSIMNVSGGLDRTLKSTQKHLSKLRNDRSDIASFTQLKNQSQQTRQALEKQQATVAKLSKELSAAKKPSENLQQKFKEAERSAEQLTHAHASEATQLDKLSKRINKAGYNTKNLAKADKTLARDMARATNKIQAQQKAITAWKGAVKNASKLTGQLKQAGVTALKTGAGLMGLGYLFKRTFVDTAAEFERYETILTTIEGSRSKAKKAMDWVQDFAATTPYRLDKVTESYVKLRAYGLNPTDGLLRTLGDTSSAMGKDLMQSVEAIADAVTGENERLKEFGIKARSTGNKFIYEYTVDGKTKLAEALKTDRAQIQKVLSDVFNSKFSGSMDKQAKTWEGMLSNMGDQWTRYVNMVMDNGLFDWMKSELGALLAEVNKMAANGELQRNAIAMAKELKAFFKGMWSAGKAVYQVLKQMATALKLVADALGGWNNLAWLMIGMPLAAKFIGISVSVYGLFKNLGILGATTGKTGGALERLKKIGKGFGNALLWLGRTALPVVGKAILWLGRALMANPIGLLITAIGLAAYLIIKHWKPIKAYFSGVFKAIKRAFDAVWPYIKTAFKWSPLGLVVRSFGAVVSWFKTTFPDAANAVGQTWEKIRSAFFKFHPLGAMIKQWNPAKDWWANILGGFPSVASNAWKAIQSIFYSGIANIFKALKVMTALTPDWALPKSLEAASLDKSIERYKQLSAIAKLPEAKMSNMAKRQAANAPVFNASTNIMDLVKPSKPIKKSSPATASYTTQVDSPITVYAQPGMNEEQVASLVVKKQRKAQLEAERKSRGRLHGE